MRKPRSHQIDQLAQRVFHDALPPGWVVNEQFEDYAKDYLVEIGENNGELSGCSFFVQLKGQQRARLSADGTQVKFSIKSKYATYYLDKIKDLPVFLVVVDVKQRKGWWLFLQPVIEEDQSWRQQGSIMVNLPAENVLTGLEALRKAVDGAKKWMRLHHPESIHETVVAHKERLRRKDPRFDVAVSLVNDQPMFMLLPKEKVPLTFTFTGDRKEMETKISDLVDKGVLVTFQPGEVLVTGSKLFEQIEEAGCAIQTAVSLKATLTVACMDAEGRELARLNELPGRIAGGRKELRFEGELTKSPLTVVLGPIAFGVGGSLQMNCNLHRWDAQGLRQLAYFDRLRAFFQNLPASTTTMIECQQDGNTVFAVTRPFQSQPFMEEIARYIETLWRARTIAERFGVSPLWSFDAFDQDAQETLDHLHAVFFGVGWSEPKPYVRLKTRFAGGIARHDVLKAAAKRVPIKFAGDYCCTLLGEKIELGKLVFEYTQMSVEIEKMDSKRQAKGSRHRKKHNPARTSSEDDAVEVAFVGNESTVMSIRKAQPEDM